MSCNRHSRILQALRPCDFFLKSKIKYLQYTYPGVDFESGGFESAAGLDSVVGTAGEETGFLWRTFCGSSLQERKDKLPSMQAI